MNYIIIFKYSNYLQYSICFPNIRKKLISKSFTFWSSLNYSSYINKFTSCRNNFLSINSSSNFF